MSGLISTTAGPEWSGYAAMALLSAPSHERRWERQPRQLRHLHHRWGGYPETIGFICIMSYQKQHLAYVYVLTTSFPFKWVRTCSYSSILKKLPPHRFCHSRISLVLCLRAMLPWNKTRSYVRPNPTTPCMEYTYAYIDPRSTTRMYANVAVPWSVWGNVRQSN